MESWCFDSLDKGFISNEAVPQSDTIIRDRSVLMGWEQKPPSGYENSVLVPRQQSVEKPCFPEVGSAAMIRNQFYCDSARNVVEDNASVGDMVSPSMVTSNVISGDEESSSKFSSSVMDSNSRESSLIDLKLGGFGDKPNSISTGTARVLSSAESSTPPKRARMTSLSSQIAYCQVYGCHKDLSSAKDYHKRHKVCDVHSKTSKVVVNGIEQRFCQQCSRFHLLGEFDDGKRSCRKRLAGHNERRRKPQVGFSTRNGRSFESYTGSNFQGFTQLSTSFICQDILPRGISHTKKYGTNDWVQHIKVENETGCIQNPAYNCIAGQLHPRSAVPPSIFEKQLPFVDNRNNTGPRNVFGENVNQYTPELVSHPLFQTNSEAGSGDFHLLNTASTVAGLPGISESGCALSLLSSQSWNSSAHSSGMPGIHPLVIPSSGPRFGVGPQTLTMGAHNLYPLFRTSSTEKNHPSSISVLNDGDTTHSDFGNSKFMNVKDRMSCEDETTIDLLQLSSQLQRVENRRQSEPCKQETEGFCCLRMT